MTFNVDIAHDQINSALPESDFKEWVQEKTPEFFHHTKNKEKPVEKTAETPVEKKTVAKKKPVKKKAEHSVKELASKLSSSSASVAQWATKAAK